MVDRITIDYTSITACPYTSNSQKYILHKEIIQFFPYNKRPNGEILLA